MKIYFEYILVLNFLLDFMILYGTKRILKIPCKITRLLLGSIIGSLSTFLLTISISNIILFLFKIIWAILLVLVTFGHKRILYHTFYFYLISILIGGFIYLFDFKSNILFHTIFLIVGSMFIIYLFCKERLFYKERIVNEYIVDIYYKSKKYSLKGFIDTGNHLKSPYHGESVILTNLTIPVTKKIYIPYKALNCTGVIACIKPEKVIINEKEFTNCLIGLAKEKFQIEGIGCILPNKFKEELC